MSLRHRANIPGTIFSLLLILVNPVCVIAADDLSLTEAVTALATASFDEKAAAVDTLAEIEGKRSEAILEALLEGRLYTRKDDGKVLIVEKHDKLYTLFDPIDLTEIGEATKREIKNLKLCILLYKHKETKNNLNSYPRNLFS